MQEAGERVLSRLGMIGFVPAAALAVVAEGLSLATGELRPVVLLLQERVFVILAFLSQAAYGWALFQTRLVPEWVGLATIIFSLGGLAALSWLPTPYYPGVHFLMPFLIGILLLKRR